MSKPIPAAWSVAIDQWTIHAREHGAASSTVRTRREHLARCARTIGVTDPWEVEPELLCRWFDAQPWQRETRRGHRSTLRGFFAWAVTSGYAVRSPALMLPRVRPGRPSPHPTPDDGYWQAIRDSDPRELLMLRLGTEVGLRRMEIAKAHTRDLFVDLDGLSLKVHGKGDRERNVPLPVNLARVLESMPEGYLFPGNDHGHLSPRWVGTVVSRLLPPGFTTHSLRHRFATRTHASSGRDLLVVQKLLGHASVETTRAYVLVVDENLRAAVDGAAA